MSKATFPIDIFMMFFLLKAQQAVPQKTQSLCSNPAITSAVMLKNNEVWYIRDKIFWTGHGLPDIMDSFAQGPYQIESRLVFPKDFEVKGDFWATVLQSEVAYALGHLYAFRNENDDKKRWRDWWRWDNVATELERRAEDGRVLVGTKSWWRTGSSRYENTVYDKCFHNNDQKWPRLVCVNNAKRLVHYYHFNYFLLSDDNAIRKGDIYKIAEKLPIRAAFVDHVGFVYLFDFDGNVAQRKLNDTKASWSTRKASDFFGCTSRKAPNGTVPVGPPEAQETNQKANALSLNLNWPLIASFQFLGAIVVFLGKF